MSSSAPPTIDRSTAAPPDVRHAPFDSIEVCWRVDARSCAALFGSTTSPPKVHDQAALLLHIRSIDGDRASAEASITVNGSMMRMPTRWRARCSVTRDRDLWHVDVCDGRRAIACLSLDAEGRAIYVRSDLPGELGLTGGTYDPPAVTMRLAARDAGAA